MVSDQTASALVPSVAALDEPAPGLNDEALRNDLGPQRLLCGLPGAGGSIAGVAHDVHCKAASLLDGLGATAAVGRVGEQGLQPRDLGARLGHHWRSAIAVLHAGGGDRHSQQQAQRVDDEVALAAVDFLAGVTAGVAALGGAARALRVDDGRGGVGRTTDAVPPLLAKPVVHGLERAGMRPAAEGLVDRPPRRERLRQQAPGATGSHDAEASVEKDAPLMRWWRAASAVALEQVGQQGPLRVRQIGVQAAGAVISPVLPRVAHARRSSAWYGSPLSRLSRWPHALDTSLLQRLAHRLRTDAKTAAAVELPRQLVQSRARHLVRDAGQHRAVVSRQQCLASRATLDRCVRWPQSVPRALVDSASINARAIDLAHTP